jgi:hypothetical protein
MDEQVSDPKKRFTPLIVLCERMLFAFADIDSFGSFSDMDKAKTATGGQWWRIMDDWMDENRVELERLQAHCKITPENVQVYARGKTIPNVFSWLHLEIESLMVEFVCPH